MLRYTFRVFRLFFGITILLTRFLGVFLLPLKLWVGQVMPTQKSCFDFSTGKMYRAPRTCVPWQNEENKTFLMVVFLLVGSLRKLSFSGLKKDVNGNVAKAQSCAVACIFLITSFKSLFFKLSETDRLLVVHGAPSFIVKNQRTIALFFPLFALGK